MLVDVGPDGGTSLPRGQAQHHPTATGTSQFGKHSTRALSLLWFCSRGGGKGVPLLLKSAE